MFSRLLIIYMMHMCYRRKQPSNIEKKNTSRKDTTHSASP